MKQGQFKPDRWILLADIHAETVLTPLAPGNTVDLDHGFILRSHRGTSSLDPSPAQSGDGPALTTPADCDMSVAVIGDEPTLCLWSSLMTVDHLYYRQDQDRFTVSNDLRVLAALDSNHLDPAGLYCLFQFGAVSPPLSLSKNVKRVPPGHLLKLSRQGVTETFLSHSLIDFRQLLVPRSPEDIVEDALAKELASTPSDSSLFFSGGVDSGLLAALTRRLLRRDLRLINCDFSNSFGSADPEAQLAREMASCLGLKLETFTFDITSVPTMLERIGRDYSFPFSDFSTIATNLLAYHATSILNPGSWVVDGTGADGLFFVSSSLKRLRRMYRIPRFVRRLLASPFRYDRLFYSPRLASRYLGMIHQSLQVPLLQAEVISNTRLGGIAFLAKDEIVREVLQAQQRYLEIVFRNLDDRMQLSLLDILHICVGIYAPKGYDPLRIGGLTPFFPFLTQRVIHAGLYVMKDRPRDKEPKKILKDLLLKHVPYEMVYRAKSGFTPPMETILLHDRVKEYLNQVVLSRHNPLRDFVYPRVTEQILKSIWSHRPVPKTHLNFLWNYIFASSWLSQQPHFSLPPG